MLIKNQILVCFHISLLIKFAKSDQGKWKKGKFKWETKNNSITHL